MVMLDGVQVWGIDGPAVLALEARREFSLRDACFLSSFPEGLAKRFHSNTATAPPWSILLKTSSDVIESHNRGIAKTHKVYAVAHDLRPLPRRARRFSI